MEIKTNVNTRKRRKIRILVAVYYSKDSSEFSGIDFQTNCESKEELEKMVESFNASPYTKRKAVLMQVEDKNRLKMDVLDLIIKSKKE